MKRVRSLLGRAVALALLLVAFSANIASADTAPSAPPARAPAPSSSLLPEDPGIGYLVLPEDPGIN